MGYLGRRIGLSQDSGNSNPTGANGAVGGGILDLIANQYFERQGDIYNAPGAAPAIQATGGIISDYTSGSDVYRAHIFSSSGTFEITQQAFGNFSNDVDYLIVGGGGGGGIERFAAGGRGAGGGGAGLLRYVTGAVPSPIICCYDWCYQDQLYDYCRPW